MSGRDFSPGTAVVTPDSGIGRATAVALARDGLDVGITWHTDEEGAQATAEEVRGHDRRAIVARPDTTELTTCGDDVGRMPEAVRRLALSLP